MEWDSPWGVGFPGWHIECSAMSSTLLGTHFDIHTGGVDHIPVHHNNEIAQSVCAHGDFVNYWLHNAFVTLTDEAKMSKSLGTGILLSDLMEKGYDPLAFRYLLLSARYSSPLSFSYDSLSGAEQALRRLREKWQELESTEEEEQGMYRQEMTRIVNDDLDTPKLLAFVWEKIKDENLSNTEKKTMLADLDTLLGLGLDKKETIPEGVAELTQQREAARAEKNFAESDRLRQEIENLGYTVSDGETGPKIRKKKTT